MSKLSFVRTMIPVSEYKEKETLGNTVLRRFDAEKDEAMDLYLCVECAYNAGDTADEEVTEAYEAWKQAQEVLTLSQAKRQKTQEIERYDTSSAVNGFILNGQKVWLDFELRDRVYQGNERLQRIGRKDTTLWLGKQCYNLSIEQAQNLISQIEAYAKDCYNVTAAHKAAVEKLQTVEEVLGYDYKAGYPEQLEITI